MNDTRETALAVSKSILNGDWKELDGLLADDFTYTGDGMRLDKKGYTDFMQGMKSAMSDMRMDFTHTVVEGDRVSIRFVTTCRHTGNFMGAPATKKNLVIEGIFVRKIVGDKVAQEWQTTDLLGTLSQMGFGTLLAYALFNVLLRKKKRGQGAENVEARTAMN